MIPEKDLKEQLRVFIVNTFMGGQGPLKDSESLFAANVIDSFAMLELLAFIEKKFGISVNPSEVTMENFDSISKIVQLIEKKK
jgi:acyl carrier protein